MSEDLDILSRTIFGEARGEGIEGMAAVANVILNRVRRVKALKASGQDYPLFGNGTIKGACLRKWQFSCWNDNDPNKKRIEAVKATDVKFAECIVVAKAAIAGLLVDNTNGSMHYHALNIGFPPSWKEQDEPNPKPAVIIGRHAFYNNIK